MRVKYRKRNRDKKTVGQANKDREKNLRVNNKVLWVRQKIIVNRETRKRKKLKEKSREFG